MNQIADYTAGLQYFDAEDGIRLAYRDEGERMPLVVIGGINRNGIDFKYLAPHLEDIRLIRIDLRGRGASDWAPWETYLTIQEAKDVIALLDHLEIEKAAFLGTSRGGIVTMDIATIAKERMLGGGLNDIGTEILAAGATNTRNNLGRLPEAKTYEEAAIRREQMLSRWSNVPEGRWLDEVQILFDETEDGLTITYDPRLKDAVTQNTGDRLDYWTQFEAMSGLPLVMIRGAESEIVGAETAAKMAERHPGMFYAEVPGRGHSPWLDEPEALAAIKPWLAACRERL